MPLHEENEWGISLVDGEDDSGSTTETSSSLPPGLQVIIHSSIRL